MLAGIRSFLLFPSKRRVDGIPVFHTWPVTGKKREQLQRRNRPHGLRIRGYRKRRVTLACVRSFLLFQSKRKLRLEPLGEYLAGDGLQKTAAASLQLLFLCQRRAVVVANLTGCASAVFVRAAEACGRSIAPPLQIEASASI